MDWKTERALLIEERTQELRKQYSNLYRLAHEIKISHLNVGEYKFLMGLSELIPDTDNLGEVIHKLTSITEKPGAWRI